MYMYSISENMDNTVWEEDWQQNKLTRTLCVLLWLVISFMTCIEGVFPRLACAIAHSVLLLEQLHAIVIMYATMASPGKPLSSLHSRPRKLHVTYTHQGLFQDFAQEGQII